jgi:hypothetical protein
MLPTASAPEHRLHNVFRVARVAGDAVRGAKHQGMVLAEDLFEVLDGKVGRFHGGSH